MALIAGIPVVMKQSRNTCAAVCIAASTFVDKNYLWVVASRILSGCVSKDFERHDLDI
jgi:hypothetical protein